MSQSLKQVISRHWLWVIVLSVFIASIFVVELHRWNDKIKSVPYNADGGTLNGDSEFDTRH